MEVASYNYIYTRETPPLREKISCLRMTSSHRPSTGDPILHSQWGLVLPSWIPARRQLLLVHFAERMTDYWLQHPEVSSQLPSSSWLQALEGKFEASCPLKEDMKFSYSTIIIIIVNGWPSGGLRFFDFLTNSSSEYEIFWRMCKAFLPANARGFLIIKSNNQYNLLKNSNKVIRACLHACCLPNKSLQSSINSTGWQTCQQFWLSLIGHQRTNKSMHNIMWISIIMILPLNKHRAMPWVMWRYD